MVAGYTDITFTFGATSQDLNNGNGPQPYDCIIDCNSRTLDEVYRYVKYVTRRDSTTSLNGHTGDMYQAVGDIRLPYDAQSGDFTEGDILTGGSSGATGIIVADHDDGSAGALILRDVVGSFADDETITDETSGSATSNIPTGAEEISRVKASPFGTYAGGKFFAARGVWLSNVASADSNNYELIDSTSTQQIPPATVAITINNTESGDRVSVFRTTGDNEILDRQQYTIQQAHTAPVGYIRVLPGTVPADTPATGSIRVVRRDGSGNIQGEERYNYTAWTSGGTYDEFTLSSTTTDDYDTNDTAYVPYIDELATGTSVSESLTYVFDRYVLVRVRIVGMRPFQVKGQITTSGLSVTTIRATDIGISKETMKQHYETNNKKVIRNAFKVNQRKTKWQLTS